jgi:GxxExxY protein
MRVFRGNGWSKMWAAYPPISTQRREDAKNMNENEISAIIVDSAIDVHRTLGGPGLLESVYEEAMAYELTRRNLYVKRQVAVPILYKDRCLATPLKIDLLVSKLVVVECKSTIDYNKIFESQVLTYLRLTGLKLGMVVNFGERLVKDGIHRIVNEL